MRSLSLSVFIVAVVTTCVLAGTDGDNSTTQQVEAQNAARIPLEFTGGHDTDPRDRGRPVVLVAAGLNVSSQVFRDAFRGVHPAGPGTGGPTPDEARANKRVLLDALSKYGVTNDRLDEVSNYYRYRRESGQIWRHRSATGYATLEDGKIAGVVLTDRGAGYTSLPEVTVPGHADVRINVKLAYAQDLATNGSIDQLTVGSSTTQPTTQP